MQMIPLRSLSFPASYLEAFESVHSENFEAILKACGVKRSEITLPGATIDGEQLRRGLEAFVAQCDPGRPPSVQLLQDFSLTRHGLLGVLSMTAATAAQALDAFLRFFPLVMPAFSVTRRETPRALELHVRLLCDFAELSPVFTETFMGGFLQVLPFVELGTLTQFGFRFSHAQQRPLASYRELFGEDVAFGASGNVVSIDRRFLGLGLATRNSTVHRQMLSALGHEAARSSSLRPYTQRVKRHLEQALLSAPGSQATMRAGARVELAKLARALGLSARTLSRRLREEGTSLPELQTQARIERAAYLLAEGRHGVAEVARAVGYQDAGSFAKAFKRVTGKTPSEARGSPA